MTDIEKKALALLNEVWAERGRSKPLDRLRPDRIATSEALCRAIEQHEAFRQEVSDAVEAFWPTKLPPKQFARFVIAKPDPLVECLLELDLSENDEQARHDAVWLASAIAMRGGKIVWEDEQ